MRPHHRLDQPETCRKPRGDEAGQAGERVRPEEDRAKHRRLHFPAQPEPQGHDALDDEPATERVEREQCRELGDDASRPMEPEPPPHGHVGRGRVGSTARVSNSASRPIAIPIRA